MEIKRLAKKMAHEHGTGKQSADGISEWIMDEISEWVMDEADFVADGGCPIDFAADGGYPLVSAAWKDAEYDPVQFPTTGFKISDAVYDEYMHQLKRIEKFLRIDDW